MSKAIMPHRPSMPLRALLTMLLLAHGIAFSAEPQTGFFAAGKDQIRYEIAGSGFPLVLVSGGSGMDLRQWDLIAPILAKSYRVIRYDPRGIGQSDNPTEKYSDAADLHELLEYLDVGNTILIGLSSSGGFVLEYALQYPAGVAGIIAAAPLIPGFQFSGEMLARLQIFSNSAEAGRKSFLNSMFDDPHFIPAPLDRSIRSGARQNMGMNIKFEHRKISYRLGIT